MAHATNPDAVKNAIRLGQRRRLWSVSLSAQRLSPARNRKFADSPLEETVRSELVSGKHRFLNVKKKERECTKTAYDQYVATV